MMTAASYLLIFTAILRSMTNDQVQFSLSSLGLQFLPSDSNTFIANISNARNRVQCLTACLNNPLCLTVNFDSSTHQCSLFSSWLLEGNITPSPSSKSQITYISREPALYTAYRQPCTLSYDPINRYMQCISAVWVCPDRYFFNGSVCVHQQSLDESCQNGTWCDSSKYLICSNWSRTCRCNSSMKWNGSICESCKLPNRCLVVNHLEHLFSLSSGPNGNQFRRS